MSGPKVVRIVTREEIIAMCEGHLARLRTAAAQWEKVGRRNGLLSDEAIEKTLQRVKDLEAILAKDRFLDLQKQVPIEIEFLKADMARRIEEAAKKAAAARVRQRRLASMARQKLDDAKRDGLALPDTLWRALEASAKGASDEKRSESALAEALALSISRTKGTALSTEQRELAEKLQGSARIATLNDWLDRHQPAIAETERKVDAALAELAMLGATVEAAAFAVRQDHLLHETSEPRQRMLADTLMLDVTRAINARRERGKLLSALAENAAELGTVANPAARALAERAEAILAREDAEGAVQLTAEIAELIAGERKARAASAKRRAILTTLTELGYEVREGMETAWVKDGKLVMRRAANPEMGVEVKGATGSEQIQFRPVRFGAPAAKSDRSKDRDIETLWCFDFGKLHKQVQARQGELKIDSAMAVGTVEVLFVSEPERAGARRLIPVPLKMRET